MHERRRVLGVVLGQQPVRGEGVVDAITQCMAKLGLGHAAVQRQGGDELHVVDTCCRGHVEHRLDDALAVVRLTHGRQRQRHVVESDRQLHPRPQERRQGVAAQRLEQGTADGVVGVGEGVERLWRIDDAGAVG